jgi:16S rRNA G966 N2-methylase RsmD
VQTNQGKKTASAPRKRLPGLTVKEGYTPHPFDAEFAVKTSGLVPGRHLVSGHRHDRHATAYYGVAPSVLRSLVKRWQRSGPAAPLKQTTFVDLGAGMGRAVLLASTLGFKAAIGVELHPALVKTARRNVSIWRASGREVAPMQMIHQDAVEFALPPGPVLVFLFNPFGATVLRRLLKAWSQSSGRKGGSLDVLYVNNEQEDVLERERGWTRLYAGKIARSAADAIADYKIMGNQPEGEYASSNWEDCSIWRWVG